MAYIPALEEIQCAECGMWFAVPRKFARARRKDGMGFYCPLGHGLEFKPDEPRQKSQTRSEAMKASWERRRQRRAAQAEEARHLRDAVLAAMEE